MSFLDDPGIVIVSECPHCGQDAGWEISHRAVILALAVLVGVAALLTWLLT